MSAPFRIASDQLSAEIAPVGAELVRLTGADGADYLWDGDPRWWSGRAPILFPIVGTLKDDRFRWQGESYSLHRHGFARRRKFELVDQDESSLVLRLDADDLTGAMWPFDFRLDMRFAIEGSRLSLTADVTNRSETAMPVSFGFHPALRWPLPGAASKAGHAIRFAEPEPAPIRKLDSDGLIDPVPLPTPVMGKTLALDDSLFVDDALIFDQLRSRSLSYAGPGTPTIKVDFPAMPDLGLWMKPGADYLCIEPWQGYSDPQGFGGTIDEKPGMVSLGPGATRRFAMGIAIG